MTARRVVVLRATNYFRVGAEVYPFDDADSRSVDAALQWARYVTPIDPARVARPPQASRVFAWRAWPGMPLWVRTIAAAR